MRHFLIAFVALAAWPLLVVGFAVCLNPNRYLHGGGIFELALHDVGAMLTTSNIAALANIITNEIN